MFHEEAFGLLADLEANNNRDWFMAHRDAMRTLVQDPFADLLQAVSGALADAPLPLMGSAATMFRMNRDVRFSNDKSPYKTSVSGLLTPGGTKSEQGGLLYLQMGKDGGFVAAGFHALSPAQLGPFRDRMIDREDEFDAVLTSLAAAGRSLSRADVLSAMPRGYAEHGDHRHADYLKLNSLIVSEDLPKSAFLSDEVIERAARLARDAAPLLRFGAAA